MKNHVLVSVLVGVLAIFVGVTIAVNKMTDPLLVRLLTQQNQLLSGQKAIQKQLQARPQVAEVPAAPGRDLAAVMRKQEDLEQRLAALEKKLEPLFTAMRNAQAPGAAGPQEPTDEYTKVHQIDIGKSPVKGDKAAPITIVEFVDFQCPFCARFHSVIEEVLAAYPGKVSYVLKNFPLSFHPQARPAAKAAFAAGEQGKYFEMVELLFQNHQALSEEKFKELAKQLGLNEKKFVDDYTQKDAQWEEMIAADMGLAQKVEVRGTPTYYLNGRKTIARDLAAYKKEIDELLKK